jgi:mono/diheme cytochrome c family protein
LVMSAMSAMSAMLSKSAMSARLLALPTLLVFVCAVACNTASAALVGDRRAFLTAHCGECHADGSSEGGFAIESLGDDFGHRQTVERWTRIHDRVTRGEMPPPGEATPPPEGESRAFLDGLDTRLLAADIAARAGDGRAAFRRLSRAEYEHALQDLLAMPWLRVKEMLPADGSRAGFDKVGEGLAISPVQVRQYLAAANRALDLATAAATPPPPQKLVIRGQNAFAHQLGQKEAFLVECFQPAETSGSTSSIAFISGGNNIAKRNFFTAPHAGHYSLRLTTWGFWCDRGVIQPNDRTEVAALWSGNQPLGFFDAPSLLPQTHEITAWLDKGALVNIDAETIREWNHHTIVTYVGPGVAVDALEVEGPLAAAWPPESHRRLYGDLPEAPADPEQEARRLLAAFLPRAFRRPVPDAEVESFVGIVRSGLAAQVPFRIALRQAYATAFCSAAFLFREEQTGPLDDSAIATRLALWLWNSTPDDELLALAAAGRLREDGVLHAQVERLLTDRKSDRFIVDFLDQWLKLATIDDTTPDRGLYPEVAMLNGGMMPYVRESMVWESRAFFREMLDKNLPAANVIASDFAMLNGKLAELYAIPGVDGSQIRRVPLPADSHRGGFLTQAAVLKVTANGATTSPVIRGTFVNERLLGREIPPPPPGIPSVDPDTRGATTIREQLAKHRADASCAGCHATIDPPGFALESFDVIGGYRNRYRSLGAGEPAQGKLRGGVFGIHYKYGPKVDPSGEIKAGKTFTDIDSFRVMVLSDRRTVARSLLEKLIVYATGSEIHYADRREVESILDTTAATDFSLRSLIYAIAASPLFQSK